MGTIGERIRLERERLGHSQTTLGGLSGVTKKTQMLYETDKRIPKADYLVALAQAGIDVQYVLSGNKLIGSSGGEPFGYHSEEESASEMVGFSKIPIYDIEAAAGDGRLFDAELIETAIHFDTEQLQHDGLNPSQLVGIRVRGDSMGETLQDGDRVLVDRSSRTPDGVFLLRMDGGLRIKRVQRVAGGAWMLISDNTHYQPEMIKPEEMGQVEIIGECRVRIGKIN
ncbi:XRE family transcriptional regulator [Kushneria phyllosphaerae]|nr:LexA family transcriptional regulator [Kushneria phyllosphaerae]